MYQASRLMKFLLLLGFGLLCHVTVTHAIGPKCYSCDHVADPKDCDRYEQCSDGESCYVQRFMGQQLQDFYRMGCMSNNVCSQQKFSLFGSSVGFIGKRGIHRRTHARAIDKLRAKREDDYLLCLQCCSGDYCNLHSELCGAVTSQNLRCFECSDVKDPTHCEKITECEPHHNCLLHVYFNVNAGEARYDMGCQKDLVCTALENTISTSTDHVSCASCCNDKHYCNFDLCKGVQAQLHGSSSNATGGSTGTTSVPFTIQIPGTFTNQRFNSQVTLHCKTLASAQITWYFNGSKIQQAGVHVDSNTNDLIIHNLNEKTIGNYTCFAAVGTAVKETTTVVSVKPAPPIITSFTASPPNPRPGNSVTLTCKAQGWPSDIQFEWAFTRSGSTNPPPHVTYRTVDHGEVLMIGSYEKRYHEGMFTCTAKNSVGTSAPDYLSLP